MNNPNEFVGFQLAKDYMDDRRKYVESRHNVKQTRIKRPSRLYRAICRSLVSIGHILVALGRRLKGFDLVVRQSKAM